jgi:hypothetical protein
VLPASVQQAAAARYEDQYGPIEDFPDSVLGAQRERALLFKHLATLRTDAPLGWRGPGPEFTGWAEKIGDKRLLERCLKAQAALSGP